MNLSHLLLNVLMKVLPITAAFGLTTKKKACKCLFGDVRCVQKKDQKNIQQDKVKKHKKHVSDCTRLILPQYFLLSKILKLSIMEFFTMMSLPRDISSFF